MDNYDNFENGMLEVLFNVLQDDLNEIQAKIKAVEKVAEKRGITLRKLHKVE